MTPNPTPITHTAITITVNVPRQPTEREERIASINAWCDSFQRMRDAVVRVRKAEGAHEFVALGDRWTHAQYMEACQNYELRKKREKRQQMGFLKYWTQYL